MRTYTDYELTMAAYWCAVTLEQLDAICSDGRHTGCCRKVFFSWVYHRFVAAMNVEIANGRYAPTSIELECVQHLTAEVLL